MQPQPDLRPPTTGNVLSQKDMTFVVSPPEINFNRFVPHQRYHAKLVFKNQTKEAKYLRLMQPESRFFKISEPKGGAQSLKMAAGLSITYEVYFTPEADTDYECDLVAYTDQEKFVVPVRAIGSRGHLTLPDMVHFPNAPIKATSRTTVLLTNTGTKPCKFKASTVAPFAIQPAFGMVEPQANLQIAVEFTPTSLTRYESTVVFDLGQGDTQSMRVTGECTAVQIQMSTDCITIPKTFISLERQGVIRVANNSDSTVQFCWKSMSAEDEKQAATKAARQVGAQRKVMATSAPGSGVRPHAPMQRATASGGGRRTSQNAADFSADNQFLFDDDVFTIEPIQGSIPAKGFREFVITFNPQLATSYFSTAHLDIQGMKDRLPLAIKGAGLGPQCGLSFDSLDLGDIFIKSMHQYEVVLENRGSIEAKFALMPQQTLFGPKFSFTPNSGMIPAGSTQTLCIKFSSDIIGIVSETFKIHVQGSRDELELHFKGRVIGPTFHFDVEEIDYGNVSYNFWHQKQFHLINTSEIPMNFQLRVPEDGAHPRKEFAVVPSKGKILPHAKHKIQVDFLSNTVQEYNAHLVVDIDDVGENLDSLPIKATCIVPDIVVSRDALDFGHCFVGYPYSLDVELRNDTALSAKYEFILPADDDPIRKKADIIVGGGDVKERKGIVSARATQRLKITLTAKQTGNVHVPLFVRILGSERPPHLIAISAKVTGPKIDVQPKALDFGSIEVLTEVVKPIVITNDSPIPATFTAKLVTKHAANVQPPFVLKQTEGTIKAHSTAHLHVMANLDEAMKFTDELLLTVQNNNEQETIALTANGRGFTLVPDIPMDLVEFGDLFTTVPVKKTFTLRNRGRKPQQIQWNNERGKVKEGDAPIIFTITPERATINGKSEEMFTIEGLSQTKGVFTEKFSCKLSQSHKLVFKATVQGNFQPPLLQYSSQQLAFTYVYNPSGPPSFVSSRPLTMRNVSPLDLEFSLKINKAPNEPCPFTIDQQDFVLKKGESGVVNVSFDAAYRGDRETHKTSTKLLVCYANHGQRDTVTLTGDLQFPNLALDAKDVDFGCVLNDTEQRRIVTITNSSKVAAAYTWVFEEDQPEPVSARTRKSEKDKEAVPSVPINNVFDLVPFRGTIDPGASERVEVVFRGQPGRKFNATAVCQVEGGPDYPLQLQGEASSIQYKFDRVVLDFGSQEYDTWQEKELILTNSGRVPFCFQVDLACLSRPGMVEVSPLTGLVKDKVRLVVKFSPRVPDRVDDHFRIQVAHFEPQLVNVKGMGLYSSVVVGSIGMPPCVSRKDPQNFKPYLLEAKNRAPAESKPSSKQGEPLVDPVLAEAERLYFRDIITEDAMIMKTTGKTGDDLADTSDRTHQIKRKTFNGEWKYILSRYTIDLGSVVKGETKKRSFKVTNTSTSAINFSVDRRHLATTGVTLTPDKFPKLASMGSQSIDVTLNTRTKGIGVGEYTCEVLLDIKGGPLVLLDVRALVIVPAVEMSTDRLDFGKVQVGLTRIISVSLTNSQCQPCDWNVVSLDEVAVKAAGKKAPEKRGRFVCTPASGVLAPNQTSIVEVAFIPVASEQVSQKMGIRVTNNPKVTEILCTGTGEELDLEVQPPEFDLPPVFPHQNSRQTFQLVNRSSVPVEVFSLNFDKKYLIEDDILLHADELFEKDVLLLPPREVGASLPDHLMEAYYNKLIELDKGFAANDLLPAEDGSGRAVDAIKPETVNPSIPLPTLEPLQEDSGAPKQSITILTGPTLSGKSVLAKLMAQKFHVLPLNIDKILRVAMEFDTAEGAALRSLAHRQAEDGKPVDVPASLLATVFRHRLRAPDAAIGVVVDDLRCFLTSSPEVLLEAFKEAAAQGGIAFACVSLTMDNDLIALRQAEIQVEQAQEDLNDATVSPLPEEQYDRLDEAGRRQHDMELKHFRDCKKRLTKATQEMQRIAQARATQAQGKKLTLLHEEVDKELQEAKEAEESQKKKPAGKKAVQEAPPPPPKWEEMNAMTRYRKLYAHMRSTLDDSTFFVIPCDQSREETLKRVIDAIPFAALAAESAATTARERAEAATRTVTIPAPVNRQRIERPPERRTVVPAKYFKILTPDTRAQTAPAPPTDAKVGKDAKAQKPPIPAKGATTTGAAPPGEQFVEETRWIIAPKSSVDLTLQFCCDDVAKVSQELRFGVVGSQQEFPLDIRTACACPDVLRDPKAIFPVAPKKPAAAPKARGEGRYASKTYSSARKVYEFGPLLIATPKPPPNPKDKSGKDAKAKEDAATAGPVELKNGINSEKLVFTNNGLFTAEVALMLENDKDRNFAVHPDNFSLAIGESVSVKLVAMPDSIGEVRNAIIACIKDNPEPLRLEVSAIGSKPDITIDGKKDCVVDFGRLLLRRAEERKVTLKNVSALPSRWRIVGGEKLPPELKLDTTSGLLQPGATAEVAVRFESERANSFNVPLKLELTDADGTAPAEQMPFTIKAEAHDVVLEWTKALDFKTVRVGEAKKETIKLVNKGPYEVAFQFRLPKRLAEVLTITPQEGTLRGMQGFKEAAVTQVEVVFRSDKEALIGKKGADLEVSFIEPTLKELVYPVQRIAVAGEALFNKFQIKPLHINFGPCLYKQKKQATFDITNTGCFEIKYKLFSLKDGLGARPDASPEPVEKGKKPAPPKGKGKDSAPDLSELQLGAFTVSPSVGTIPVGGTATIAVSIQPEGNVNFHEVLGIHIDDRDPASHKDGIPFDLEAESCVPGIIADLDLPESDSIFEEQQIVTRLDGFKKQGAVFSRDERVFSFGTSLSGRRLTERFRITNPVKVPCTVNVAIIPRGDTADAKAAAEAFDLQGLKADGGKLFIGPHEHRYVTVGFTPNSLNTFNAIIEATVEGGLNPKTRQLRFELRGEGSLPNVALDLPPPPLKPVEFVAQPDPNAKAKGGKPPAAGASAKGKGVVEEEKAPPNTLVMPRTIVGTKTSRSVTVRNVGDLPATVRFAFPTANNPCFAFPSRNEDIVLQPGAVEKFAVFFEPSHAGDYQAKLTMSVQDNHYEDVTVTVLAEGYHENLTFTEVDENTENRLSLGDCYVGAPKSRTFGLRNHSDSVLRYVFASPSPSFTLTPAIGHINPGSTKRIEVTYLNNAVATENAKCTVTYSAIDLAGKGKGAEWDAAQTAARWVTEGDGEDEDMYNRRPMRKVTEPIPEPQHTVTHEHLGSKDLAVTCTCDTTSYELVIPEDANAPKSTTGARVLFFKRTKLFQQRQASLLIKNTGRVALPFKLRLVAPNLEPISAEDADTFRLKQASGTVAPGQTHEVSVTFRPVSVDPVTHLLVCEFPHGAKPEAIVELSGTSECPLIHFELPPSDYLATRDTDLKPVDPASCIVEFFSRGVHVRNTVRFMVLNPTSLGYDFEWEEVGKKEGPSPFKCATMRGSIHSGKKYEMVFEFNPDTLKLRESQWVLNIVGRAQIPFLVVGHVSEPEVYFSQTKVHFGQVIVGARTRQQVLIENRESIPYPFAFDALPANAAVTVTPLTGVVPPNGSLPIDIAFSPAAEELYNYTLACKIRKAVTAMTCNVKGEGYVTHDSLRIQGDDGHATPLVPSATNEVNLGPVQVNGKVSRKLILTNQGRFNLDYKWSVPPHPSLTLTPLIGTVTPNGESACELVYAPTKESVLQAHKLSCKITNGHTYNVSVSATATVPNVALSWKNYDFGPVFVQSQGAEAASVVLTMTNKDRTPLAVDCLFDNKDYLEVDVSSFVLQPGERRDIRVAFSPKECTAYQDTISFTLNDLTTVSVGVQGEGTQPKVEVQTKAVRFGVARVGEKREVEVRVVCKSKIPTAFDLKGLLPPELDRVGVSVAPEAMLYLKPRETKIFAFTFRPQNRMRPFQSDMDMRVAGQLLPFVTIGGSCQGAEVHLDNKQVSFGPVVVGTRVTKRITIMNTGDLGLDYNWQEKRLAPDFTMMPVTGFISAHSEQVCELTYHPTEVGRDGRREAIEVRFSDAPSLALQVASATCVEKPTTNDAVTFTCRVRETTTNKVTVKNDTAETWNLRPSIDNPVWSAPDALVVRPRESADYVITYAPQMCTKLRPDASNDVGTVFFPLPTGTALVYRLEGIADLPSVAAPPIERDIMAKVPHSEKLTVNNWLKVPQRFAVAMKWNHDPNDDSIVIKGVPSLDVPPNATREFKLQVSAYKEGKIAGSIHFVNEDTREYQYYNLVFNVKAPKEVAVIDLKTAARVRKVHEVSITNPLSKQVTLTAKSDNPDVVVPATVALAPKAVTKVPVEFFPLLAKDYPPARVVLASPELGDFPYTVNAVATPPLPEKPIRLQCALGQCVSTTLRFTHFCKAATDFTFKFADPKQGSFIKSNGQMLIKVTPCVDPRVGQEVPVDITFEPCKIGDSRETVEITSPVGGTYTFVLQGTCTPPQRQGPFDVKPNQTAQLQFKNVFNENVTFQFASDAPQFVVAKASEMIQAKKTAVIAVQYKPDDPHSILRGKLTVTGTASGPDAQPVSWVYYLRGLRESDVIETPAVAPPAKGAKK